MCDIMKSDPKTAHFVDKPTVFLSHTWSYIFANVVAALLSFAEDEDTENT